MVVWNDIAFALVGADSDACSVPRSVDGLKGCCVDFDVRGGLLQFVFFSNNYRVDNFPLRVQFRSATFYNGD